MRRKHSGYTLIELMVGITLFVILGTIVSAIVLYSTRNSTKSESMSKVRERMDFAVQGISRQLRYSKNITCYINGNGTERYGVPVDIVTYTPRVGVGSTFAAFAVGDGTYRLASGSGTLSTWVNLISDDVRITTPSRPFTCTEETVTSPSTVRIQFTAKTAPTVTGIQSDEISVDTLVTQSD